MKLHHQPIDKVIVKEVQDTYGEVPIQLGDVVLDLGANIGAASRLFLDKGAGKVIAIEPDPRNYAIARRNLNNRRAVLLWAAVGAENGRMMIYARPDKPFLTSTIPDDGRTPFKVSVLGLSNLLAQYQPSVLKCDIEFGEYDLPQLRNLPAFVRVLALEVHIRYDLVFAHREQTDDELAAQRQEASDLIACIEAQGFREVRRKDKLARSRPIKDETGLGPLVKSIDAIWSR